jgi:O-antigen ligase
MVRRAFLSGIVLLSALVDILANIHLGPISAQGVLTVFIFIGITLCLLARPGESWRGFLGLWPFSCLLVLSIIQFFGHASSMQAYQTILLLWIFLGLMIMLSTAKYDPQQAFYFEQLFLWATAISASIYGLSLMLDGLGTEAVIGARSFGVYALPGVALLLGRWALGSRVSLWLAIGLTLLIALSLSRTALVVAILLFPLSRLQSLRRRGLLRLIFAGMASILVLYFFILYMPALSSRFLGDDTLGEYVSGDATLDMSGRAAFWAVTIDSYLDSPWLGKGPGSANNLIAEIFPDIGHPHNEYLRILHDSGIVGLTFLLVGFWKLLLRCRRTYQQAVRQGSALTSLYLGTFLALIAILLTAITDNTFSYLFIMVPLGVVLGTTFQGCGKKELKAGALAAKGAAAPMGGLYEYRG